jgi:pyruvate,orthophosphate dikinase
MPERRYVFAFDHPHDRSRGGLVDLLGGKGANLADMTVLLGLPVPPGFTVTTEACRRFLRSGRTDGLDDELTEALAGLEHRAGRRFGDHGDPLLVSVRSGARHSMPGMMDTVLDLGLGDRSVEGLAARTDERFAFDTYRRFVASYARVVLGLPAEPFEAAAAAARAECGAGHDGELPAGALRRLVAGHLDLVRRATGADFPQDPRQQLRAAVEAVFRSWHADRARAFRDREGIAHDLGTAVTVQAMVFGNRDGSSGSGVAFSRDPSTGEAVPYGDVLANAQGEDVVSGSRRPAPLATMAGWAPAAHRELLTVLRRLEVHHRDLVDVEFTVEQGRLWILQARVGARTGAAAVRIAVELTDDPDIGLSRAEALGRIELDHLEQVLRPAFGAPGERLLATGLPASPGAAVGRVYFSADDALDAHDRGEDVILVRVETSPEDVGGFEVAAGVLTTRGGPASHAAVVARGWGIPAVVGAETIEIGERWFRAGSVTVHEGTVIALDGSTGAVLLDVPDTVAVAVPDELEAALAWADDVAGDRPSVGAAVTSPDEAARARALGARRVVRSGPGPASGVSGGTTRPDDGRPAGSDEVAADVVLVGPGGTGPDGPWSSAPVPDPAAVVAFVAEVRRARPSAVVAVREPATGEPSAVGALVAAGVDELYVAPDRVPAFRLAVARAVLGTGPHAGGSDVAS